MSFKNILKELPGVLREMWYVLIPIVTVWMSLAAIYLVPKLQTHRPPIQVGLPLAWTGVIISPIVLAVGFGLLPENTKSPHAAMRATLAVCGITSVVVGGFSMVFVAWHYGWSQSLAIAYLVASIIAGSTAGLWYLSRQWRKENINPEN